MADDEEMDGADIEHVGDGDIEHVGDGDIEDVGDSEIDAHHADEGDSALIAAVVEQRAASVAQEARLLGALHNTAALLAPHAVATGDDPRG